MHFNFSATGKSNTADLIFFFLALFMRYGRVRLSARLSPFGLIQGVFGGGVHVLHVLLDSIHPSFLESTAWLSLLQRIICCVRHVHTN